MELGLYPDPRTAHALGAVASASPPVSCRRPDALACCAPRPGHTCAYAAPPLAPQCKRALVEKEELFAQVHVQMQAQIENVMKNRRG